METTEKSGEHPLECCSEKSPPIPRNALRIFALLYWHFTLLVRDNATIIIVVDELLDLIGLQGIYQCLDLRQILVAFLNSDYIYISSGCFGIIALIQQSIVCNSQACFHSIVAVQDTEGYLGKGSGNLCCLQLYEGDVVRILYDILGSSGQTYTILQSDVTIIL